MPSQNKSATKGASQETLKDLFWNDTAST